MKDTCVILTNIFGDDCLRVRTSGESEITKTYRDGKQEFG